MAPLPPLLRELLDLLAPPRCAACDQAVSLPEPPFCAGCALLLEPARRPLRPGAMAALYVYGGPIAAAIQGLKYRARTEHAGALGARLALAALPAAGQVVSVVPLPLHPRRLRERGFNQSALLARPVARALGVPLDCGVLQRVRDTHAQADLPREARLDNVRGAFALRRPGRPPGRVLLVDDVRTSGATLLAAAEALVEGGAPPPLSLTLACAG